MYKKYELHKKILSTNLKFTILSKNFKYKKYKLQRTE